MMSSLRIGSLFAGIGGADLALERLGCKTVWFSEIEDYPSRVFSKRFPQATNLGDVRCIVNAPKVDVLVGGFPCQDLSVAGLGAGIEGERSGLWSEFSRLIAEQRPKLVLIENVAALLRRGFERVLWDLTQIGYAAEWDCIPAAAVGAPHVRDRIWIVAYSEDLDIRVFGKRERIGGTLRNPPSKLPRAGRMEQEALFFREPIAKRKVKSVLGGTEWGGAYLSHPIYTGRLWPTPTTRDAANNAGPSQFRRNSLPLNAAAGGRLNPNWVEWLMGFPVGWTDLSCDTPQEYLFDNEPNIPRIVSKDEVPNRGKRLKAIGNALVPQVMMYVANRALEKLE